MKKTICNEEQVNPTLSTITEQNVFIVWKPEFATGIPIIDEQHRGIVSTINSLHYGMQSHNVKNVIKPIIETMYCYAQIHFQVEENYLEMIDSPEAARHKKLHRELTLKLSKMGRERLQDKDHHRLICFLKQWWLNHVCKEDLIFRELLIPNADVPPTLLAV